MLNLYHSKQQVLLGIDIRPGSVAIAAVNKRDNNPHVTAFGFREIPSQVVDNYVINDEELVSATLSNILIHENISATEAVIAIPDALATNITIQVNREFKDKEIEEYISYTAENYFSYPLKEINFDFTILGQNRDNAAYSDVLIHACRTGDIANRIRILKKAGIKPIAVDIESLVVQRYLSSVKELSDQQTIALIDIGVLNSRLFIFDGGKIIYSREDEFGDHSLLKTHNPPLDNCTGSVEFNGEMQILWQIQRSLQFFFSSNNGKKIHYLLLAGRLATNKYLHDIISHFIGLPVQEVFVAKKLINNTLATTNTLFDMSAMIMAFGLATGDYPR